MARAVPVQVRFAALKTVWFPSSLFFSKVVYWGKFAFRMKNSRFRFFQLRESYFLKTSVFPSFPEVHLDELFSLRIFVLDVLEDLLMFCVGESHLLSGHGIEEDLLQCVEMEPIVELQ